MVARTGLAQSQEAARRSRLVLISAEAGYGKTTLAAEWAEQDPRGTCWVQLSRRDNDRTVLLTHLAAALESIGPPLDELTAELSRQRPRIGGVALPLLADSLATRDPFVLVLDDAHLLTAAKAQAILGFLVDEVPPGSQLMLIARGDPGVPLARARAGGELFEIGTSLLALDTNEVRLVAASNGLDLTEEAARALGERTEGWAAAVVLAALLLRGRRDAEERIADISGEERHIADYLVEEVLKRQSDHLTTFLLGTSILDRMTAALCDAVLGVHDAAESLEALGRSNGFVIPLDDRRDWYRYHHLFGELLRAEFKRRHPDLLRVHLNRAALWCAAHELPDEAFIYAHESGDLALAGAVALATRDRFTQRGQTETVRLWFDRCTDEEIASDCQLSIAAGWAFAYQGDEPRAKQFIAAAERGRLDVPSVDGATSLRSALACLKAAVAPDGLGQMLRDAEFVRSAEKEAGTRWYFSGSRALGVAHVLMGRPHEAIAPLEEVIATRQPETAAWRIISLGYLSFATRDMGDRRAANRWAVQATIAVEEGQLEETVFSSIAHTASALAHIDRGDHRAAAQQLENVRRTRPLLRAGRWLDADLALRCADVSLDLGDRPGGVEFARIAEDAVRGYPDAGNLPARLEVLRERIRLGRDYGLTAAELRLMRFLPTHLSLQEIAERIHLSRTTVKTQVASIYSKLGVQGRSEAVEVIEETGLVPAGGIHPADGAG